VFGGSEQSAAKCPAINFDIQTDLARTVLQRPPRNWTKAVEDLVSGVLGLELA